MPKLDNHIRPKSPHVQGSASEPPNFVHRLRGDHRQGPFVEDAVQIRKRGCGEPRPPAAIIDSPERQTPVAIKAVPAQVCDLKSFAGHRLHGIPKDRLDVSNFSEHARLRYSESQPKSQVQYLHPNASRMPQVSQGQTFYGVGRLHRGHRNMGCVGYSLQNINGTMTVVRFDPMPDAAHGDVFHLTLEDGRILECQVLNEYRTYCAVLDGPRAERRHHRRPAPTTRAYL